VEMGLGEENPHIQMAVNYSKFLHDASAYPPHLTTCTDGTRINHSALTKDEERQLSDKWSLIDLEKVRNTVYTFKVAEPSKGRCRVVHSCKVNEKCKAHDTKPPPFKLHTTDEINKILREASFVCQFDAKSMYDQFPLSEEVGSFFVFKDREGRYVALNRLPMGFCYACGIAQGLSLVPTTFKIDDEWYEVRCIVHLDNYLFAFTKKEGADPTDSNLQEVVRRTLSTFFKRTMEADLQLNELSREQMSTFLKKPPQAQWEQIYALSPREFTFLGITYNLETNTRTAAEKSWDKLHVLQQIVFPNNKMNPQTTPRHISMIMGVINWIKRVINVRHIFYNVYRNTAELAYILWARPELWDTPLAEIGFMFQEIPEICRRLKTHINQLFTQNSATTTT